MRIKVVGGNCLIIIFQSGYYRWWFINIFFQRGDLWTMNLRSWWGEIASGCFHCVGGCSVTSFEWKFISPKFDNYSLEQMFQLKRSFALFSVILLEFKVEYENFQIHLSKSRSLEMKMERDNVERICRLEVENYAGKANLERKIRGKLNSLCRLSLQVWRHCESLARRPRSL